MNLFHSNCGGKIEFIIESVKIRIEEFGLERIAPAAHKVVARSVTMDRERKDRYSNYCSECNREQIELKDMHVKCTYCFSIVPLDEAYEVPGEYLLVCESCAKERLAKRGYEFVKVNIKL